MRPPAGAFRLPLDGLGHSAVRRQPLTREGALLLSLFTLNSALINHAGYVSDLAVIGLGATVGLLLICRSLPSGPPPTWLWAAVVAGLGLSVFLANFSSWPQGWPVWIFVIGALAAAGLIATGHHRAALAIGALGGLTFLAVCWRWDPSQIDVLYGLRSAGHALLDGRNPYLALHLSTTLGSPRLVHFTYGPVVAALAAVGLLFGDPRVISVLAAAALAAALYQLARSRSEGWQLAVTVCVTPLIIAMVINAWPLLTVVAGIAWWLVLRRRHRVAAIIVLGLTMGCVPVQAGPLLLVMFLRSRREMTEILAAAGIGLVIVAAFALWTGISRYWYYTIGIHFNGTVGRGSLSLAGILTLIGHTHLPGFLGIAVVALAVAWVVYRPTPGLGGALSDAAVVTIVAMFFAKFAFIDYYFVAFAAVWLAIAAGSVAFDEAPARPRPGDDEVARRVEPEPGAAPPGSAAAPVTIQASRASAS